MMITVEGTYDGEKINLIQKVPFTEKMKVLVIFSDLFYRKNLDADKTDPIKALRGCSKNSNLTEKLLKSRQEDRTLEETGRRK